MPLRGISELITGAEEFGLRAADGGLRPPPPSSVDPSGIPTMPTDDPGGLRDDGVDKLIFPGSLASAG
jgi:hypothetical protein